ncbi:polymorphic toxin-type HINT domain-containing protein [Plantactinospora sp. ZYX-F-223]|uniref:polymorphic toxin-type HINT domain-containing protein n=1 Tax=Plantactinospora sp. ZYX-F-223 TaxID=3144103 RepID=UPI0031FBFFC4
MTGDGTYVDTQEYTDFDEPTITTRKTDGGVYVKEVNTYDLVTRRLTRTTIRPESSPVPVSDRNYDYDPAGNITSIADTPQAGSSDTQCFRYDTLQRLTRAWTPKQGVACDTDPTVTNLGGAAPYWLDWTYDKVGNRRTEVSHTAAGNTTRTYTLPTGGKGVPRPHAVTSVTTEAPGQPPVVTNYGYDATGNTTCRPAGTTANTCPPDTNSQHLTWDFEGHLASVSGNATTAGSYIYDANGNRLIRRDATGTTLYLPGHEIRYEAGVRTPTRYYTFAGKLVASRTPAGLTWTHTDHQGSQHTTIHPTSQAVTTRRQTPYGTPRGQNPIWANQKGFVGGDQHPTGLTHLGAREYDPTLGKFISVDPLFVADDPRQHNAYQYGTNNPITHSDPSGLGLVCGEGAGCAEGNGTHTPDDTTPGSTHSSSKSIGDVINEHGCDPYDPCHTGFRKGKTFLQQPLSDQIEIVRMAICINNRSLCKKLQEMEDAHSREIAKAVLLELSGINDAKDCVAGSASGCIWTAIGLIPWGKWKALKGLDDVADAADLAKKACSFSGDTKILLADGSTKAIKDIKVGDLVLATDPETGEQGPRRVTHLWIHQDVVVSLKLADGIAVTTTEDHPFWNHSDRQWQEAQHLDRGDLLYTSHAAPATVEGIDWESIRQDLAYNLTVAGIHTYYVMVGKTPVLVHNSSPVGACPVNGLPHGKLGEAASLQRLQNEGYTNIVSEVQFLNSKGRDFRADFVAQDANGNWVAIEAKTGRGAEITPGQATGYPELESVGVIVDTSRLEQFGIPKGSVVTMQVVIDAWTCPACGSSPY